ncbi:hypothetical protein I6N90_20865 [Paenibacillus sp. GSMTC-2017]|uniref:hypothetical protein n=1 Tax=Paenibacillus sp. GSMTC-2017 TaxID=2794350 RepID=UPI0018D67F7B|nr:hypothetical protein [Paenibacillus sp. GSMTC-2017]MBH5320247.1 hypothetical protein [Paenibacillus sp. GSMTC-2017]
MKNSMKKLTLVLMATMILMFSLSATASASGDVIQEVYLGQQYLQSGEMSVSGNVTIPASQAYGPDGISFVYFLVWALRNDGTWVNVQGDHMPVLANGQSQSFVDGGFRQHMNQPNLSTGIYKVTFIAPPGSTWSNLHAWTWDHNYN